MIKAGILGATGYVGAELVRILSAHPKAALKGITSQTYGGLPYRDVYGSYRHRDDLVCQEEDINLLAEQCDVIFIAMPHGLAAEKVTAGVLEKCKVVDLGADFRLKDPSVYEAWYKTEHKGLKILPQAVYGLTEIYGDAVKEASLVANPGCYPTCSLLALYPLVKEGIVETNGLVIDAKSGVSGAGRAISLRTHFCETNESVKAYGVLNHRHTPEIAQILGDIAESAEPSILFTPHLVPMNRGMLSVCYSKLKKDITKAALAELYQTYYAGKPFIRLCEDGIYPETRWVKGSNYCDIGWGIQQEAGMVMTVSAIDNLQKGAAGQAVQNMNLMFGLAETCGLATEPLFP